MARRNQDFLLTTHVRPDGDGLGSVLALAEGLHQLGKRTRLVVASVLPPRYDFLDPDRQLRRFHLPGDEYRAAQVVLVLDTGTWNQLGDFGTFLQSWQGPRAVIDHHLTQDDLRAIMGIYNWAVNQTFATIDAEPLDAEEAQAWWDMHGKRSAFVGTFAR